MTTDWPVRLIDRDVTLRPLATTDHDAWRRAPAAERRVAGALGRDGPARR